MLSSLRGSLSVIEGAALQIKQGGSFFLYRKEEEQ